MLCTNCGKKMKRTIKDYQYTESGLDNIVLSGIPVYTCECGEEMPMIPHIEELHRVIAFRIAISKTSLSGPEARFLRKQLGLKSAELARMLGMSDVTISRWENSKEHIGAGNDRLLRILVIRKIEQELVQRIKMPRLQDIFSNIVRNATPPKIKIPANKVLDYDFGLEPCSR